VERVTLIEVGLRDGLQSEQPLATEVKLRWADALIAAGVKRLQVTSFVNPSRVPSMADAEAMCAALATRTGVEVSGLVLNAKGLDRAHAAGLRYVDLGLSASPSHSQRNTGKSLSEALNEVIHMIGRAHALGLRARAAVQCAFGCPPEDDVTPTEVLALALSLVAAGTDELAIADSSGQGTPDALRALLKNLMPLVGQTPVILHLHDTHGHGYDNLRVGLEMGVRHFDTAFGGLGGCPFIPDAAGNISTEITARLLDEMVYQTGIDAAAISQVSREAEHILGKVLA
jgi:hydroxymethylglutaryl-CoA lyase